MHLSDKSLAYALLRIYFGVNFAGHGFVRILTGVRAFAQTTAEHLDKTFLPHALTFGVVCCIPFIEVALGLALLFGIATRIALGGGAVFMMALTLGVAANQQWDVASQQLLYSLVFFVLLFFREHDAFGFDSARYAPATVP